MPRQRPATSGYARLAQADEDDLRNGYLDDSEDDDSYSRNGTLSQSAPRYAPITGGMHASGHNSPSRYKRRPHDGRSRGRSNSSGVDIKAINARLERWAEEIASKFKIHKVKGKSPEEEHLEIHHSVFQAPEGVRPLTAETLADDDMENGERMTKQQFDDVVESVRIAIENGVHPKMISQGSSGSYFARNASGKVVGVFKPKDEEPYAVGNPKWTKWIHRNLFPCFFGRECLIPNLSYVSEAAAYVLDSRLRTNIVPYTDVVWLSSKSFYYNFWDRRKYWGKKQLPAKVGSFQVFLKGFKDANVFLRDHPWPDQNTSGMTEGLSKKRKRPLIDACRMGGDVQSDDEEPPRVLSPDVTEGSANRQFQWTDKIKQAFREELEKLVILDYIMRNTDRGLDNWMVKIDYQSEEVSIVSRPPRLNGTSNDQDAAPAARAVPVNIERPSNTDKQPYRRQEAMSAISRSATPTMDSVSPTISVGAIDNSLSWPWKHPDAWRSFPFGWLFLPVSLIGQPFSQKTRDHFLPLLTSKQWWGGTQLALRRVFSQDADFKESMFARQIAVMKGQAWNVVETLKQADHGPLELTRRARVCVWDDLVEIPVAIPLGKPSLEMQRRRTMEEEEMDIGASRGSAPIPQHDLLSFGSPTNELPNPNRFELSREQSSTDLGRVNEDITSPATIADPGRADYLADHKADLSSSMSLPQRPGAGRARTRVSLDIPRRSGNHQRYHSLTARRGSHGYIYDGDDLEGDLGYSAAAGMEGQAKKVIVERLETVKSKNPVFNWC